MAVFKGFRVMLSLLNLNTTSTPHIVSEHLSVCNSRAEYSQKKKKQFPITFKDELDMLFPSAVLCKVVSVNAKSIGSKSLLDKLSTRLHYTSA